MAQPAIRLSRPQLWTVLDIESGYRGSDATWRWDMRVLRAMEKRGLIHPLPEEVPAPGPVREALLFDVTKVTDFGAHCLELAEWTYTTSYFEEAE